MSGANASQNSDELSVYFGLTLLSFKLTLLTFFLKLLVDEGSIER